MNKIRTGIAIATAALGILAGAKAYADQPSGLKSLEDYATKHGMSGTVTLNHNGVVTKDKVYRLEKDGYTFEFSDKYVMIEKDGDRSYILYDAGNDGNLDSLIMAPGSLNPAEMSELELSAMFKPTDDETQFDMDMQGFTGKNGPKEKRSEIFYNKDGTVTYNNYEGKVNSNLQGSDPTAQQMKTFGKEAYSKFVGKLRDIFGVN